jgi:pantoate--beta-alanine ligase
MVQQLGMPVEVVPCASVREPDGLAMSSRNMRLTAEERALSPKIYQVLQKAVQLRNVLSPEELRKWVRTQLEQEKAFMIDYVEVAEDALLQPFKHWNDVGGSLIFVAIFLGQVRLIDNMRLF